MATLTVDQSSWQAPGTALSTGQAGNGDSTNILDRAAFFGPAALVIASTVGATPTVTVNIQCSTDGVNWFNVPYALVATPETVAVAALTITTATTVTYLLRPFYAWRYLKLVLSANTNVTLTATAYVNR